MRILYVCTGNSFRSVVAEALTRKHHPSLEVESAGIDATDHVAENAKSLLEREDALEFVKPSPDQISRRALEEADIVVGMMPSHKEFLEQKFDAPEEKIIVWNIEDPVKPGVDPRDAFERIEDRVRQLEARES